MPTDIIEFIRKKDYRLEKELGQGACGKTVLLHDDVIDEHFVCKKYIPFSEDHRQELFKGFVREIKLLHRIYHKNVVRVFNYFIYPDDCAGYLLMEYIEGMEIHDYVEQFPDRISEVFRQTLKGFRYLESNKILHRDIRPGNIMVADDGTVKIIDLGFGKQIENAEDFDKSISLNWWCELPNEFQNQVYDFQTEVYFVGKLFEQLVKEFGIGSFEYKSVLGRMCHRDPKDRIQSFFDIEKEIRNERFPEIGFSKEELSCYRNFADLLDKHITKIEGRATYRSEADRIITDLEAVYRTIMLEKTAPDAAIITRCFLDGTYYYAGKGFPVYAVRDFLQFLKGSTPEKLRIVIANLHTRLDAIERYTVPVDDEIPF